VSGPAFKQTGTFTLTAPKGNIVVDTTEFGNGPVSMTVAQGTKHFKGIVGSGSGSLALIPMTVKPNKAGGLSGKFTFTVNLNVTMPTS
jgi:hypothetical protein